MIEFSIDKQNINMDLLDEELRALDVPFVGLSHGPGGLRIHMEKGATQADRIAVREVVVAHDASTLTAVQQERAEVNQRLANARANNAQFLQEADFDAADPLIRAVARKLTWLELEVRELRANR